MTTPPEEPPDVPKFRVQAVPGVLLDSAADLLFGAYASDPCFGDLYGLSPGPELDSTRQIFRSHVRTLHPRYRMTLGCRRDGRLVGVCVYYPETHEPLLRALSKRPFTMTGALLRHTWLQVRWRHRLGRAARARWNTYGRLGRAQLPRQCHLHVQALGVDAAARRSGVAERLLAAIDADPRWRPLHQAIVVETWHASKVEIYQRLGFTTASYSTADGVECWTMVRPLSPTPPPAR